jgi:hypothetical protein
VKNKKCLYVHKSKFLAKIDSRSIYKHINDNDTDHINPSEQELAAQKKANHSEFFCTAYVTKDDDEYNSMWIFPIKLEWLASFDAGLKRKIQKNVEKKSIPTEIIYRVLPSIIIRKVYRNQWLLKYWLKERASIFEIRDREFLLVLIVSPRYKSKMEQLLDKFLIQMF